MASAPSKVLKQDLGILARKINEAHDVAREAAEDATGAMQHAIKHAAEAGKLLAEAKEKVGHGGWIEWLAENFKGTRQTAAKYMRVHKSLSTLNPNGNDCFHLSMMKLLSQREEEDEPDEPAPPASSGAAHPAAAAPERLPTPPDSGANGNGHAPTETEATGAGDLREASHGVPAESTAAPAPLYDAALILIPPHLRPAFEAAPLFDKALEHFRQIAALTNQIGEGPAAAHFKVGVSFERDLRNARDVVKFARPYVVCPHCKGSGRGNGCSPGTGCRGMGWMTQDQYERVPPELKAQKGAA